MSLAAYPTEQYVARTMRRGLSLLLLLWTLLPLPPAAAEPSRMPAAPLRTTFGSRCAKSPIPCNRIDYFTASHKGKNLAVFSFETHPVPSRSYPVPSLVSPATVGHHSHSCNSERYSTARHASLLHICYSPCYRASPLSSLLSSLCVKRRETASRASHLATSPTETWEGR
jgi:hypothetical protein